VERIESEAPQHPTAASRLTSIADGIRSIRTELDDLREIDVRQMSQLLYPAAVDRGLEPAARMMVRRVPAAIDVRLHIDDAVRDIDATEPPSAEHRISRRILLLRVLEEAISNALRHGHASELVIRVQSDGPDGVMLTVDDDGVGLPGTKPTLNGLGLLAARVAAMGGSFSLTQGPLGGSRLSAMVRFEASAKQPAKARH
jgi:signal transduction histidine kinase